MAQCDRMDRRHGNGAGTHKAGIELYGPRLARYRRTWSFAVVVLAAVVLIAGPLIAVLIAKVTGLNSRMGWSSELQLVVFFGLTAVLLISAVVLIVREASRARAAWPRPDPHPPATQRQACALAYFGLTASPVRAER